MNASVFCEMTDTITTCEIQGAAKPGQKGLGLMSMASKLTAEASEKRRTPQYFHCPKYGHRQPTENLNWL